ncbi:hypothetical protein PAXRUDRAFT_129932, partial [Paxillus rubicundulus Ve08.2h10]
TKAIPGILKKPNMQPDGTDRSPGSPKARPGPKPTLKGKTAKPMNAEGSSRSKRRRAPGTELEEDEVDAAWPMKKVLQDFAKKCWHAATPFPEASEVPGIEDTRQSTHTRKV